MELKAKCDTCIHGDVCFRRPTFEGIFTNEEVMTPLKAANEMTDWIEIGMECKDYIFDYNKFDIPKTEGKKGL